MEKKPISCPLAYEAVEFVSTMDNGHFQPACPVRLARPHKSTGIRIWVPSGAKAGLEGPYVHNISRSPLDAVADYDDVAGVWVTMYEFLQSTSTQAVIWGAVLLIMCAIGAYVVMFFRNHGSETRSSASDTLSSFRDLQSKGGISQSEFREIKSVLGAKLQDELDSNDADESD